MKVHELKLKRGYFSQWMNLQKTAEIRLDDGRDFKVGDLVVLKDYDEHRGLFSGASMEKKIVGITKLSSVIPAGVLLDDRWVVLYLGEP